MVNIFRYSHRLLSLWMWRRAKQSKTKIAMHLPKKMIGWIAQNGKHNFLGWPWAVLYKFTICILLVAVPVALTITLINNIVNEPMFYYFIFQYRITFYLTSVLFTVLWQLIVFFLYLILRWLLLLYAVFQLVFLTHRSILKWWVVNVAVFFLIIVIKQ